MSRRTDQYGALRVTKCGERVTLSQALVRPGWLVLGLLVTTALTLFGWHFVQSGLISALGGHPLWRLTPWGLATIGFVLILLEIVRSWKRGRTPFAIASTDEVQLPRLGIAFERHSLLGICTLEFREDGVLDDGKRMLSLARSCALVTQAPELSVQLIITRLGGIRPVSTIRRWASLCNLPDLGTFVAPEGTAGQAAAVRFTRDQLHPRNRVEMS